MQIFIGNLNSMATANQLAGLFMRFGNVKQSYIERDRVTGRSLGFGFIEMDASAAKTAIWKLNRFLFMNAYMEVQEVR